MDARVMTNELVMDQERRRRDELARRMPVSRDPMDAVRLGHLSPRERIARDLVTLARWLAPSLFAEGDRVPSGSRASNARRVDRRRTPSVPTAALRRP